MRSHTSRSARRSAARAAGASPARRSAAATRGRSLESTPDADHAAPASRLCPSATRGAMPRSTSASHAHLIVSASSTEASTASRGAMMSKSAWTCSRGSPHEPGPGPAAFSAAPLSTPPPARAAPPRNVTPTQDARRVVACSAVICRTSDDRRSRRSVTSAPERESSTCASRLDSPSGRRAAATSAAAAALSASGQTRTSPTPRSRRDSTADSRRGA